MLEALAALAKLLLYAGALTGAGTAFAAASLGTALSAATAQMSRVIRIGALAAAIGAIAHVVVLILRLDADFSGPTVSAVLESATGTALVCQLAGCALLLVVAAAPGFARMLGLVGALSLVASFGANGHAASVSLLSGTIAATHVAAASWWVGALLLLRPACSAYPQPELAALVRRFSVQAIGVVVGLVLAGAALILTLVDFNRPGWFSPYAQMLAAKLALAASVLVLAAYNKFRLTPDLESEDGHAVSALRKSITFEIALITGILATTAILTTYTSPHI